MKKIALIFTVFSLLGGAAFAGAHIQVPDTANDASGGASAAAGAAGLDAESTGGKNASQKGADRGKN